MKFIFAVLSIIFSLELFATTSSWAEGKCDPKNNTYEGATRDFYNRGAGKEWQNKQGDWLDATLQSQGTKPFALLDVINVKKHKKTTVDVTRLAKYWQQNVIKNHGFLIQRSSGEKAIFYAKENSNTHYAPLLTVKTKYQSYHLRTLADTALDSSTYRCVNQQTKLNSYHHLLFRFDISKIKEQIVSATLSLTLVADISFAKLNVFAVEIKQPSNFKEFGLSNNYTSDEYLRNDKAVIYYEDFENDDWMNKWGVSYWNSLETTTKNNAEHFVPINNAALAITIKKGEHTGISAHYLLHNSNVAHHKKVNSAYFRYNLRLGNSWNLLTNSKLPGFAGIYGHEEYRGGWGGRRSTGQNGWSSRGIISLTLSDENPLAARSPLGSYLYHANMKYTYGDERSWNLSDLSVLKKNQWYSIEQHVQMNSIGKDDGHIKAWVNGVLVFYKKNIRFSDNPLIGIESVWLNVYHGGSATAPKDLTLYIDDIIIASKYIGSRIHSEH